MSRAHIKRTTRLGRVANDLHSKLCVIAWHERKTFAEVLSEVAGQLVSERFAKLPKAARDRLRQMSEAAEQAAGK